MLSNNRSYKKSNRISKVHFKPSDDCCFLAQKILKEESFKKREFYGDAIVNDLCDVAGIPKCGVIIHNRAQSHRKNSKGNLKLKVYGFYKSQPPSITIYNKTAIRKQILAPKSFFNTLIHEYMHHYDLHVLKINSMHTSGFYARVKNLTEKLLS